MPLRAQKVAHEEHASGISQTEAAGVEALYSLLGLLELTSYFLGQVAYGAHFDFGGAGQVRNHQRHLT